MLEPPEEPEELEDDPLAPPEALEPEGLDEPPLLAPLVPLSPPPLAWQALPVTVSLPFTQFLSFAATFGLVGLADAVVSVESDPLGAGVYVLGLAPVELLLVAGAVGVAELFCCLDFWRSPIASAPALLSAKMEIKNTGASLRIWVSFRGS